MSTYWGYRCISHNPHLESEHWYNHRENMLGELLQKKALIPAAIEVASTVWDAQLPQEVHWLAHHLNCSVEVVNEYGETLQEYERKHEALPSDTGPRSFTSSAAKSNLTNGGKDE